MSRGYKHVSTGRRLTAEQAARVRQLRDQVEREKPEIVARARAKLEQVAELERVFTELKKCREQKGLSLSDVQELTDIDRSVISKLETGKRTNYTIDTVVRYAGALGKKVIVSLIDAK
jgi:predicted XRE-type DNA-binding protein